jgi:hypothetical protein
MGCGSSCGKGSEAARRLTDAELALALRSLTAARQAVRREIKRRRRKDAKAAKGDE